MLYMLVVFNFIIMILGEIFYVISMIKNINNKADKEEKNKQIQLDAKYQIDSVFDYIRSELIDFIDKKVQTEQTEPKNQNKKTEPKQEN